MSLRDNINRLRDQVLVDLNSGHDYYTDTKLAWQIVRNAIQNGHTFSIQNTITGTLTSDVDIDRIAEAKASRDVLVHNRGIANKTYEAKAGPAARFKNGERIEISEQYHREIWELLRKVTTDISNAAIAKVS